MKYREIIEGRFINRPNRFIAHVLINGAEETVHVKNTGRCRELLLPDANVRLEVSDNPNRKTKYDLVAVYKENLGWVNIDSQAPNKVVQEWLETQDYTIVKPEYVYGDSRIDFYMEKDQQKYLMEVKSSTVVVMDNFLPEFDKCMEDEDIDNIISPKKEPVKVKVRVRNEIPNIEVAKEVRKKAYVPYSHYYVGAALVCKNGKVFAGCNVENQGIMSICAERVAFTKAISEGERDFDYIVICGGADLEHLDNCTPCGYCRQFMSEFVDKDFKIFLLRENDEAQIYHIQDLLPHSFDL